MIGCNTYQEACNWLSVAYEAAEPKRREAAVSASIALSPCVLPSLFNQLYGSVDICMALEPHDQTWYRKARLCRE